MTRDIYLFGLEQTGDSPQEPKPLGLMYPVFHVVAKNLVPPLSIPYMQKRLSSPR